MRSWKVKAHKALQGSELAVIGPQRGGRSPPVTDVGGKCDAIIRRRDRGLDQVPSRPSGEPVARTAVLLFLSACSTAVIHALIPDHWLPFVLLARAQRWTERRTLALVGLTGFLHVVMSLAVGALAVILSLKSSPELAQRLGASLESLGGGLLIVFGLTYGIGAHMREARAHDPVRRAKNPPRHVHAHGHILERWFTEALSGGALVAIIGISPCFLLQPILFAAAGQGRVAVVASAGGFAVCTMVTMLGVTLFALRGMRRVDLPFFTRYGDLISGLFIAAVGAVVWFLE